MNDSPDSTLILVSLEDVLNVLLQSQISLDNIDIASLLLLFGSVGRKGINCEFRYSLESSRERVVEARNETCRLAYGRFFERRKGSSLVDSDNRVTTREQQAKSNVRSCRVERRSLVAILSDREPNQHLNTTRER